MKKQNNNWMAVVGLVLVCVGLASAAFSEPPSDLYDLEGEKLSTLLVFAGFAGTIVGLVLLVIAARKTTQSMAPEKKTRANIGVGIGILLQLTGLFAIKSAVGSPSPAVPFLFLFSVPVFAWGCMNYAEGKGHSKWLGLVGVVGVFGLAILTILPEQHEGYGVEPGDLDSDA